MAGFPERVAEDPNTIATLIGLCRTGHICGVERWIAAGHPVQATHREAERWHHPATPLPVAIESGQHNLVRLLL